MPVNDITAYLNKYSKRFEIEEVIQDISDRDTIIKHLIFSTSIFAGTDLFAQLQTAIIKNKTIESIRLNLDKKKLYFPTFEFFKAVRENQYIKKIIINFNENKFIDLNLIFDHLYYLITPEYKYICVELMNACFSDNVLSSFLEILIILVQKPGLKKLILSNIRIVLTEEKHKNLTIFLRNHIERSTTLQLEFMYINLSEHGFYDYISYNLNIPLGHVFKKHHFQKSDNSGNKIDTELLEKQYKRVNTLLTEKQYILKSLNYYVHKHQEKNDIQALFQKINNKTTLESCCFANIKSLSFFDYIINYLEFNHLNSLTVKLETPSYESHNLIDTLFWFNSKLANTDKTIILYIRSLHAVTTELEIWEKFCKKCQFNLVLYVEVFKSEHLHFLNAVEDNFHIILYFTQLFISHTYEKWVDYYLSFSQIEKDLIKLKHQESELKYNQALNNYEAINVRFAKHLQKFLTISSEIVNDNNEIVQPTGFIYSLGDHIGRALEEYKIKYQGNAATVKSDKDEEFSSDEEGIIDDKNKERTSDKKNNNQQSIFHLPNLSFKFNNHSGQLFRFDNEINETEIEGESQELQERSLT